MCVCSKGGVSGKNWANWDDLAGGHFWSTPEACVRLKRHCHLILHSPSKRVGSVASAAMAALWDEDYGGAEAEEDAAVVHLLSRLSEILPR